MSIVAQPPVKITLRPASPTAPLHLWGVADFVTRTLKEIAPLPVMQQALLDAVGTVLAEPLHAVAPMPAYDRSKVDGYAVTLHDVRGASQSHPIVLPVVGDIGVGAWERQRLGPGSCFRVTKGAPVPAGTDAIVPRDWTDDGVATVTIMQEPRRHYGVTLTGSVYETGELLAGAGTPVTAALVGHLVAAGFDHIPAHPRPRLVVMTVGDEYIEPSQRVHYGRTFDSASFVVTAAARRASAQAFRIPALSDDPERVRATIADNAMRADLLVVTGDVCLLAELFSEIELARLPMVPASVVGFGRIGQEATPLLCLPGEPGAAYVWFEVLIRPIIRRLHGYRHVFGSTESPTKMATKATLVEPVTSSEGVREFRPAVVTERRGGGYTVQPLAGDEQLIASLVAANALLVLSDQVGTVPAGASVDVMLLNK